MKDNISEIGKEIVHLCELMGIDQRQIRYVMINGTEFIGETLIMNYDDMSEKNKTEEFQKNETTFFHPMKINVEVDVGEDGHLYSNKYFSILNPYSPEPFSTFKNYNILTQTSIHSDLMLEYLKVVFNSYFSIDEELKVPNKIKASLKKNNIVQFGDYQKKK